MHMHKVYNRGFAAARRGFTFLEIMLVVVIIGILAAMVMPKMTGRVGKARSAAAANEIRSFSTALSAFEMEAGSYPTTEQGLEALVTKPSDVPEANWSKQMDSIPPDPWGEAFIYKCPGDHSDFDIISKGPDRKLGTDDDINNFPKKSVTK